MPVGPCAWAVGDASRECSAGRVTHAEYQGCVVVRDHRCDWCWPGVEPEMHMHIDEPGQHRHGTKIQHLSVLRGLNAALPSCDASVFDEDERTFDEPRRDTVNRCAARSISIGMVPMIGSASGGYDLSRQRSQNWQRFGPLGWLAEDLGAAPKDVHPQRLHTYGLVDLEALDAWTITGVVRKDQELNEFAHSLPPPRRAFAPLTPARMHPACLDGGGVAVEACDRPGSLRRRAAELRHCVRTVAR